MSLKYFLADFLEPIVAVSNAIDDVEGRVLWVVAAVYDVEKSIVGDRMYECVRAIDKAHTNPEGIKAKWNPIKAWKRLCKSVDNTKNVASRIVSDDLLAVCEWLVDHCGDPDSLEFKSHGLCVERKPDVGSQQEIEVVSVLKRCLDLVTKNPSSDTAGDMAHTKRALVLTSKQTGEKVRFNIDTDIGMSHLSGVGGEDAKFASSPQFRVKKHDDGGWCIVSLDRVQNPTYYNGRPLPPGEPQLLQEGMSFRSRTNCA